MLFKPNATNRRPKNQKLQMKKLRTLLLKKRRKTLQKEMKKFLQRTFLSQRYVRSVERQHISFIIPKTDIIFQGVDDDDSMDVPLSQFPFSDDDNNDNENNDNDDSFINDDVKDEEFVALKEKKPRGRPPSKKDHTLYECKECNKILTTYSGLKVHLRRHTGADLAKCKVKCHVLE